MNANYKIRLIKESDVKEVLNIYKPYVLETVITFEYEVPTEVEFLNRIKSIVTEYPWIVCLQNDKIIGYAYAGRHRYKEAYDWSVESTIYLSSEAQRKGIGAILYETLFSILRLQGYFNVYAGLVYPNEKSEAFHTAQGFDFVCDFKKIGYKFGNWLDLRWYQLYLSEHVNNPPRPIKIDNSELKSELDFILTEANTKLKELNTF